VQPQKTVLLADDDRAFLLALTRRCQELGVGVKTAADGLEALMLTVGDVPELLIIDINMPGADGLNVCEKLGQNVPTSGIPIIILTGRSDKETLRRCMLMGAQYVRKDSEFWENLRPMICEQLDIEPALADHPNQKHEVSVYVQAKPSVPKILVVDDDPQITKALMIRLGALGLEVIRSPNAKVGALLAKTECPDLIITDQNMPEMSGDYLIAKLKGEEETKNIPVIVITGQRVDGNEDFSLKSEMLGRRGAVAYLTKPVNFNALLDVLNTHIHMPLPRSCNPVSVARSHRRR